MLNSTNNIARYINGKDNIDCDLILSEIAEAAEDFDFMSQELKKCAETLLQYSLETILKITNAKEKTDAIHLEQEVMTQLLAKMHISTGDYTDLMFDYFRSMTINLVRIILHLSKDDADNSYIEVNVDPD